MLPPSSEVVPRYVMSFFVALFIYLAFVSIKSLWKARGHSDFFKWLTIGLVAWIGLISGLASSGFYMNFDSIPPRLAFLVIPAFIFLLFLATSKRIVPLIEGLSLKGLTYIQTFRILMEWILWLLIEYKALAPIMTFTGKNYDILVGLSAPVVGYLYFQKAAISPQILKYWNYAGILILSVTVACGMLSAPTPLRMLYEDVSTAIIGTFPYALLPGFVVPFAMACHILAIRKINLDLAKR